LFTEITITLVPQEDAGNRCFNPEHVGNNLKSSVKQAVDIVGVRKADKDA
jgi:hypothetical protein